MSGAPNLRRVQRRAVAPESVVEVGRLADDVAFPPVIRPRVPGVDLAEWTKLSADQVESQARDHGAVLLRGFDVSDDTFRDVIHALYPHLAEYSDQTTPRTAVGGDVYTSTEYPANQVIAQHSEMSYAREAPQRICFWCVTPSPEGGETPLADNRTVLASLSDEVREAFLSRGVMYIRNYRDELGLPWQTAFQTEDRGELEARLRRDGMDFEWTGGGLRVTHVGPAAISHPRTGELVWFNQADHFHTSGLPAEVREALLAQFGEEDAPQHASFGDGSPIPDEWLHEVRGAYEDAKVMFPWERGDILVLDNPLITHGRQPFSGERKVLVAMAEPFRVADFEPGRLQAAGATE